MDERILVVEDDPSIRETASIGLERAGFRVTTASDGREGLLRARRDPVDLVVLDVMLPELDGLSVLRELRRESPLPVVMLTARSDTTDIVVGLELGADDYVTKPFDIPELVARVRAVLRRAASTAAPPEPTIVVGDVVVDPGGFTATREGADLGLTTTEFRLLLELARHAGQVLSRDVLLARVWEYDYLGDSRMVDAAIQRLRAKVEGDPAAPKLIRTVRGVGYRLELE